MDFDTIVVTAANEAQAAGYRAQLAWRTANGLLPSGTEALVVPDPGREQFEASPLYLPFRRR